jgi:LysR family transcriptional regulator, low CO2-responsive transcriptional regulator
MEGGYFHKFSLMTPGQLRTLLAVARHGSIGRAAAELFVTQPAVSASIAALERDLGVPLLAREGRGIRLTPSGETLARYAAECLALFEQGRDAAVAAAMPGRGRLRIAAVTTAGEYIVPPLLKAFHARYPEVEVFLEVGNRTMVLERLRDRQADLGVGGSPPEDGQIEGRPFLANPLAIVASPAHRLAGRTAVEPAELERETWLVREPGSGTRLRTEEYLARHELEPRRFLNLGSNGAVKQAVAVGLGITLISVQAVGLELDAGMLTRLAVRGTPLRRRWFLLTLKVGFLPGPAQAFLEFASTVAARRAVRAALGQAGAGPASGRPATAVGPGTGGRAG